jgi:DNA-binding response OmpR family regulator
MKVLLIEDSRFQRTANGRALAKAGYDVVYGADGEDGLGAAHENIPDLILLDMMLPKMSGLDVLRALKADVLVKHIRDFDGNLLAGDEPPSAGGTSEDGLRCTPRNRC